MFTQLRHLIRYVYFLFGRTLTLPGQMINDVMDRCMMSWADDYILSASWNDGVATQGIIPRLGNVNYLAR
jgi:hypothetical protein